ncbi:hypothetical protein BJX68DRAFT_227963 [Aspergillus pseudodeflectus]|uniref:Zn(2)-C6 fungal-type domain-containing protein n=1 Tax=Aspergillus pseudodeflectus TaxID=176178 RepID=A0ABR4L0Z8_9EURO
MRPLNRGWPITKSFASQFILDPLGHCAGVPSMGWPNRPGSRQPPSQPPSLQATSQETPQASPQTVSPGSLFSAEGRAPLSRTFTGERYYSSETNHRSHCSRACDSCRNRKIKCSGEYSGCGK